jgi:predicted permease
MIVHTLRHALRSLRRRPGFSLLAVVTIALGAGANAAVSSVAYSVLLKPLPYAEPDRVVAVWPERFMSQVDLRYLRDRVPALAQIAGVAPGWSFSLTGAGDPSKVTVDRVSGNLFETLGARPLVGRTPRAEEERPGSPGVLVLSHRFWRARFGGDRSVVGRTVKLDDRPHEIIGVMPAAFEAVTPRADAWAVLPADRAAFYDRLNFSLLVGRLAPGVAIEQADAAFKGLMPAMRAELKYPSTFGQTARIQDLRTATTGDMRSPLVLLAAAVALMLLIAGANLGTLLVARGASRAREFAVHAAIGASRGALVRLQLAEGVVLAAAGAAAGLALAAAGLPLLVRMLPRDTPRTGDVRVDAAVTLAVVGAALAVVLLFALAPSFTAGRRTFGTLLREGAATESRAMRRMRGAMVAVEIALALVLTIGAGLMLRTLWRLQRVEPGIDVDRILTLRVQPTSSGYRAPGALVAYYDRVLERIAAVPGVTAAGAIQHLPFSGYHWIDAFEIEGRPVPAGAARPTAGYKLVTGDYFSAVGQRLLAGRMFTTADRAPSGTRLIVNEAFARQFFGSAAAAIDRRMRTGREGGSWQTIVGVVSDVRTQALDRPANPEFYAAVSGTGIPAMMIAARTGGDPLAIASAVRQAVWSVDRNVPVADLQPMRTLVGTTLARPRLLLTLLAAFAAAGLSLGAIGVYGVVAFGVARRRREIGIRMALGATRASVVRLMLRESAGWAVAGLAAGTALAAASSTAIQGLLFEVPATDPATYAALAAGVGLLVTLASYAPARRAASINPSDALRGDRQGPWSE